jgi:hypothetical protein
MKLRCRHGSTRTQRASGPRIGSSGGKFKSLVAVTFVFSLLLLVMQSANATPIALLNPGFDDTTGLSGSLSFNNNLDFGTNPYVGWTEYDISSGLPSANGPNNNAGPINVAPSDIPSETTSGVLALYMQNIDVKVDQTTTHVIAAADASFALSVDVGRDLPDQFSPPLIELYAELAGVKTTIKSQGLAAPAAGTWVTETLTLAPADFLPFVGQNIGISLRHPGANNQVVFYDTVTLDFTESVPEPASALVFGLGGIAFAFVRPRRQR